MCNNNLTKRECEICSLITDGKSEKEVADVLCISTATVSTHSRNIRKKLGANCAVDVARWYILNNLQKFVVACMLLFVQFLSIAFDSDMIRRYSPRSVKVAARVRSIKN
jgi:DNA-binding CsgD family transcriptional regulator